MTAEEVNVNENPLQGTAGITSARQIFDRTDSVSFSFANSTSALAENLVSFFPSRKERESAGSEPLVSRRLRFRRALRESFRRDRDILEELSNY